MRRAQVTPLPRVSSRAETPPLRPKICQEMSGPAAGGARPLHALCLPPLEVVGVADVAVSTQVGARPRTDRAPLVASAPALLPLPRSRVAEGAPRAPRAQAIATVVVPLV